MRPGPGAGVLRVEVDPERPRARLGRRPGARADTVRLGRTTPGAAHRHAVPTTTAALVR